jgi:hypothetical protein
MASQPDRLARVRARVAQGFLQGFSPAFPRVCKGCNGSAHPCLTCVCVRIHRRARLRMRVRLHITLATLATLALLLSIYRYFNDLADCGRARVAQGLAVVCKGLPAPGGVKSGRSVFRLDRCPSHARIFYRSGDFSGGVGRLWALLLRLSARVLAGRPAHPIVADAAFCAGLSLAVVPTCVVASAWLARAVIFLAVRKDRHAHR